MNTIYPRNDFKKCVLLTNCWKQNVHLQWIYLKLYNEKNKKKKTKKKTSKLIKIYLVSSRNRSAAVISVPPSLQFSKPLTLISIHFRKKEKKEKNVNFSGMYVSSVQGPPLYTFVYLFIFHFSFSFYFLLCSPFLFQYFSLKPFLNPHFGSL